MRLAPIFAVVVGLSLSAPVLVASQSGGQGTKMDSQEKMQQRQTMHEGHRMVIGKVTDTRQVKLAGQAGDKHHLLKLSANNNTVIVDLGPMKEGAFKDLGISQGTRIWALGNSARINGKPVIFARYVGEVYDFTPKYQGGQKPS